MELLVNDIFDVYKLDIGKLQLNKKVVQVTSLVKENMSELGLLMRDKQIQFNAEIIPPSEKVNVLCYPRRIGQVLANLIKNSVDLVPDKGGRITIRTEAGYSKQTTDGNSNYVVFTIEDNGSGIPFEFFFCRIHYITRRLIHVYAFNRGCKTARTCTTP